MADRSRLLMAATALLYFGPLLAGLGGFGWRVVPAFAVIFLFWLFILRPNLWPRRLAEWNRTETLLALAAQGAMQVLLVSLCFGIGRGLGGVLGSLPPFPLLLPISVSFLSIPLSRLLYDPRQAVVLDSLGDDASPRPAVSAADRARAEHANANTIARRLIEPLADLPADVDLEILQSHLTALSAHAENRRIRMALMDRARAGLATTAELKALILHATDARLTETGVGIGPSEVLAVLPQDPELMQLFAHRLGIALLADPRLRSQCPSPDTLAHLTNGLRETQAEAPMRHLIETLRRATPN